MKTRHIAHIIIEAGTPLKVGSNASDFLQDSPIQKDFNDLPMILGTSLAGVLRKDFNGSKMEEIFGKENGSKVIISNALLLDENKKVTEDLLLNKTPFLKLFDNLPIREHTAITDKGVADNNSKFDEEVLYKGSHFKFSIELIESDEATFNEILDLLLSSSFRIGGGSTKGFGKVNVVEIQTDSFDIESYENYSSSLNHKLTSTYEIEEKNSEEYTKYTLNIIPEDFFIFGSGFGDGDADATPVYEKVINYDNAELSDEQILIPASSIKGALAHRTAFHFNKEMLKQGEDHTKVAEENEAVLAIFGHKKELAEDKKTELGQKGKILISDCFKEIENNETKTFDHVSIDRFTGGAIEGALFNEKTIAQQDKYNIEILLHADVTGDERQAFESALKDITTGMLPLGGMTTKGHGVFVGEVLKDGIKL